MDSTRQIKLGALFSYLSIAVNIIAGLLYTPWMINSIGRENFGLYTLAMSVIGLFLFDFGLSSAVTRFLSKYLAEGREDKANQCLGLVYRLYFGIDVILFIALTVIFFFIPQIYQELTPDEVERFNIIYIMAALYSVLSFPFIPVNGVLTAYEKFVQLKLCDIVHKVIMVGSMTICLLLGYGLYALVLVNAFAGIAMILMKLWCIQSYTSINIDWKYWNMNEIKELAGYSGWVTLVSLAQRCIFNIAPSILGALSGSTSIAILGIAITLEGYTYTFANALNGLFLPKVSRIVADEGDVLPLMIKIGRIQILVISLVIGGVVCLGYDFITLWVGQDFALSYTCAVLIIAPSFLQLPQEIGLQTLVAKNKVKQEAIVFCFMAVFNIVGAFFLVPKFGVLGLCLSICAAYLLRTIGLDYVFVKYLHVNIVEFFKESFIKMAPGLFLAISLGLAISWLMPLKGWYGLFLNGIAFVVIYALVMYYMAMNKFEKDLLLLPIKRILKLV